MRRFKRALSLCALQIAVATPLAAAPTINQALEMLRAESSCRLADPASALNLEWLKSLANTQRFARQQPAVYWNDRADSVSASYLAIRRLRLTKKFDLTDVFREECLVGETPASRNVLATLKLGEIIVVENFAWVPLLAGSEYFGAGLVFQKQDEHWRYDGKSMDYLGVSDRLEATLKALRTSWEEADYAAITSAQCPMPEAPERSTLILEDDSDYSEDDYDSKNALGVAQRMAVRFYAEGKRTAPSPVAQLIMAEVLLRSLSFDGAPEAGSARWVARVRRAEDFTERAIAHGAHLDRFAPLLGWLGQLYQSGIGEIGSDLVRAKRYFELGAKWGDEESAEYLKALSDRRSNSAEDEFEATYLPRPNRPDSEEFPTMPRQCAHER